MSVRDDVIALLAGLNTAYELGSSHPTDADDVTEQRLTVEVAAMFVLDDVAGGHALSAQQARDVLRYVMPLALTGDDAHLSLTLQAATFPGLPGDEAGARTLLSRAVRKAVRWRLGLDDPADGWRQAADVVRGASGARATAPRVYAAMTWVLPIALTQAADAPTPLVREARKVGRNAYRSVAETLGVTQAAGIAPAPTAARTSSTSPLGLGRRACGGRSKTVAHRPQQATL